jgi:hypothetical protein
MEASFMITQVDTTLSNYTNQYRRLGMQDLAIWQAVCQYYAQPQAHEIKITTHLSKEEAFDQMVKDNWFVDMGDHFYGLDYETTDELVLEYLIDNKYAERME